MSKTITEPLRVNQIPTAELPLKGRLGITMMPGRIGRGSTGVFNRDVTVDMTQLNATNRVRHLVSFMLPKEYANNGPSLDESRHAARAQGIGFDHFPFVEGDTPPVGSAVRYLALVERLISWLRDGENVVIHSRGGMGRCGLVAASVLVANGTPAQRALEVVAKARPGSIENDVQRKFVVAFEEQWTKSRRELTDTVTGMLKASDWKFKVEHKGGLGFVRMGVDGTNGQLQVTFVAYEIRRLIHVFVGLPIKVPAERRLATAAFLVQRNYDMSVGAFELDLSAGVVRYRADLLALNGPLTEESVRVALAAGLVAADNALPLLAQVAFGVKDPGQAANELAA